MDLSQPKFHARTSPFAVPGVAGRVSEPALARGAGSSEWPDPSTRTATKDIAVSVRVEDVVLPTYLPAAPDRNPMFLDKRVYQGSSGRVYPLPFTDRIAEKPVDRKWKAVWLENEFLRVMVLPELGGRIHRVVDKTNRYDLVYYQPVIKPALVGLAGPWISGGIEFNWPQHHRPATFLPVDIRVEEHVDGSVTAWCSDHDPMARMKGMHGVCLHPGQAYLELKVRAYNRTPFVQTFLWWANVATRVHEGYQSFLPPNVHHVADHARRSMSTYPLAESHYYGVNYGERGRKGVPANECPRQFCPPHCGNESAIRNPQSAIPSYAPNDLSFYANIPVPTSYMCTGSDEDFFGGYDHVVQAGIVHIANHHISPGKKQWTWGNHDFGYAWDSNLTEHNAEGEFEPYIELMAGVYTDNQPDFSFLHPGETKAWSQYWYPIHKIGPAQHANLNAAVSVKVAGRKLRLGICVTAKYSDAAILVTAKGRPLFKATRDLEPGQPFITEIELPARTAETDLHFSVTDRQEQPIIAYQPRPRVIGEAPPPATEPPAPKDITNIEELYLTGLHLHQYRHATRCPTTYWREALRRDPFDARCNNALGLWYLRRGEFGEAEDRFRAAIERLTRRNANPFDGEPFYHLGLCLRHKAVALLVPDAGSAFSAHREAVLGEAYAALYKATWNQPWAAAGYHALAEIDCVGSNWAAALDNLNRSLRYNTDNLRARNLKTILLRKLDRSREAEAFLRETRAIDPLDWWSRQLDGDELNCDLQTRLDLAHDYADAGLFADAIRLLESAASDPRKNGRGDSHPLGHGVLPDRSCGAVPLLYYTLGWLEQMRGNKDSARKYFRRAAASPSEYCFPARLEEIAVLETAMAANPRDSKAPYYLGNLLYDRRRRKEAIRLWEHSARIDGNFSVVWRNLGIGYFNVLRRPRKARSAYDAAVKANRNDARLLYERDQLWKRLGLQSEKRLRELERRLDLVRQRDDLSVELCALYNQTGQHTKALELIRARNFQPWEGGEGGPLGQWVRSHMMIGRHLLREGCAAEARQHFQAALSVPPHLGEAKHLLANQSDIHYWLGCALAAVGDARKARQCWHAAATFKGDFQEMSVCAFSEMTYYSALSWKKLGQPAKAQKLLHDLLAYAQRFEKQEARIDYFATSLPTMLLFDDDLQSRQEMTALFLQAQAQLGLGRRSKALALLSRVLRNDPNHALAADLAEQLRD